MSETNSFDFEGFFKSLDATREARGKTWKEVSEETSVSSSTLARMGSNKRPDADGLASLAAWSGLNPANFVYGASGSQRAETIAEIARLLHSDPALDKRSATVIEEMVRAAYLGMSGEEQHAK